MPSPPESGGGGAPSCCGSRTAIRKACSQRWCSAIVGVDDRTAPGRILAAARTRQRGGAQAAVRERTRPISTSPGAVAGDRVRDIWSADEQPPPDGGDRVGGVGTTLCAAEYGNGHAQAFGGVGWAPAQERTVLSASLAALAAKVDQRLAGEPNQERAARAGLAHLAGRSGLPFLLVYDNVEAPDLLRDLVPAAGARVLVTTRWADWGGQAVEVKLDALSAEAAVAFLQKRAMRNDPDGAARLAAALATPLVRPCRRLLPAHASELSPTRSASTAASCGRRKAPTIRRASPPPRPGDRESRDRMPGRRLIGFCASCAGLIHSISSATTLWTRTSADAMMALSAASLIEHPTSKATSRHSPFTAWSRPPCVRGSPSAARRRQRSRR